MISGARSPTAGCSRRENATVNDALDVYLKWCEQRLAASDRMSAGTSCPDSARHQGASTPRPWAMLLKDFTSPLMQDYIYKESESIAPMHELYQQIKARS